MGYRLSDASNARSFVTSVPNVNQVRNVDTAVKIIYLRTAPKKSGKQMCELLSKSSRQLYPMRYIHQAVTNNYKI